MTRLSDARQVLKGYYTAHAAIRADLASIDQFLRRTPEQRKVAHEQFMRWWRHHVDMHIQLVHGEDSYFFPRLQELMGDNGDFIAHLHAQRGDVDALQHKIDAVLQRGGNDAELAQLFHRYQQTFVFYLEQHEGLFVPLVMEHFSREDYDRLELRYAFSLGFFRLVTVMCWGLSRMSPQEKSDVLALVPAPMRFLYTHWWERAYLRKYRF